MNRIICLTLLVLSGLVTFSQGISQQLISSDSDKGIYRSDQPAWSPSSIRYALLYGPILMALEGPLTGPDKVPQLASTPENLPGLLTPVPNNPLQFNIKGYSLYKYVPYWQVSGTFTCFPIVQP